MENKTENQTQLRTGTKAQQLIEAIIRGQKDRIAKAGFKPTFEIFRQSDIWTSFMQTYLNNEHRVFYSELWEKI